MEKKFIDENTENLIGNPEQVYEIGNKKYNYNDLHNVNNLFQIKKKFKKNPKLILEIGGGYGCLMAKLKKNFNETKIISIDLPEALLLQSYYLHSIFPEKNFFYMRIIRIRKILKILIYKNTILSFFTSLDIKKI